MLKRTVSEKSVLLKHKKNKEAQTNVKNNRFLITVNVVGSVGPIRFVVNEDDLVAGVIDTTLKSYARLGRLPVLGSNVNNFFLYPAAKFESIISNFFFFFFKTKFGYKLKCSLKLQLQLKKLE